MVSHSQFRISKIQDVGLQQLNKVLKNVDLNSALYCFSKMASMQANKLKLDEEYRWIQDHKVLPGWFLDYCIQQVILLSKHGKSRKINNSIINELIRLFPMIDDVIFNQNQDFTIFRRLCNWQFHYQEKQMSFLTCFRMLKILELNRGSEYKFEDSFLKATGLKPETFFTLAVAVIGHFNSNPNYNGIRFKEYFDASKELSIGEEDGTKFIELISGDQFDFYELFNNQLNKSVKTIDEQKYYDIHQYFPSLLSKKPLFKINRDEYFYPSPYQGRIFINECLPSILVNKDGEAFSNWYGDAFHEYCMNIIDSTSEFKVIKETEYLSTLKGPTDISIIIDDLCILFEVKTRVYSNLVIASGEDEKNEWNQITFDVTESRRKILKHLAKINSTSNKLQTQFEKIKTAYMFHVTYKPIYTVNNTNGNSNHFNDKALDNSNDLLEGKNPELFKIVVISVTEYEMLLELLQKNKDEFIATVKNMFENYPFLYIKDREGDMTIPPEPSQIMVQKFIELGYDHLKTDTYNKLSANFIDNHLEKGKREIFAGKYLNSSKT